MSDDRAFSAREPSPAERAVARQVARLDAAVIMKHLDQERLAASPSGGSLMTKSLLSIAAMKEANELVAERDRIAQATWDALTSKEGGRGPVPYRSVEPVDGVLQEAIEVFRAHKIDAINNRLRELGIDPAETPDAA